LFVLAAGIGGARGKRTASEVNRGISFFIIGQEHSAQYKGGEKEENGGGCLSAVCFPGCVSLSRLPAVGAVR
jgi:hypothetical protein